MRIRKWSLRGEFDARDEKFLIIGKGLPAKFDQT
jgi:hypothetical protein